MSIIYLAHNQLFSQFSVLGKQLSKYGNGIWMGKVSSLWLYDNDNFDILQFSQSSHQINQVHWEMKGNINNQVVQGQTESDNCYDTDGQSHNEITMNKVLFIARTLGTVWCVVTNLSVADWDLTKKTAVKWFVCSQRIVSCRPKIIFIVPPSLSVWPLLSFFSTIV